jgi:hypothetical protein
VSWLRIDDGFANHEKVAGLTHQAFRLHVSALCLCARDLTDGRISDTNLRALAAGLRINGPRYTQELADARLWSPHTSKGGWKIKDYLDYNPSSTKVKEQRKRNAERQARHQSIHRTNAVSDGVTNTAPSPTPTYLKNNHQVGPEDVTSKEGVAAIHELFARVNEGFGGIA